MTGSFLLLLAAAATVPPVPPDDAVRIGELSPMELSLDTEFARLR